MPKLVSAVPSEAASATPSLATAVLTEAVAGLDAFASRSAAAADRKPEYLCDGRAKRGRENDPASVPDFVPSSLAASKPVVRPWRGERDSLNRAAKAAVENCLGQNRLGSRAIGTRLRWPSSSRSRPSLSARINRQVGRHAREVVFGNGGWWNDHRRAGSGGAAIIDGETAWRISKPRVLPKTAHRLDEPAGNESGGAARGEDERRGLLHLPCRRHRWWRPAKPSPSPTLSPANARRRPTESRNGAPREAQARMTRPVFRDVVQTSCTKPKPEDDYRAR